MTGKSLTELQDKLKALPIHTWLPFKNVSFKFMIDGYGRKYSQEESIQIIESFSFLPFEGPIIMTEPEVTFTILVNKDEMFCQSFGEEWYFGILVICYYTYTYIYTHIYLYLY